MAKPRPRKPRRATDRDQAELQALRAELQARLDTLRTTIETARRRASPPHP